MNPRSFQSDAAPASAPLPEQLLRVFHDQTRAPVPLGTAERPLELDGPGYYWYGSRSGNDEGRGLTAAIVVGGDAPPEARIDRPAQPRP